MNEEIIKEFPISIYGNFEHYNDTISKARCRIFYRYGNRNGSYITDEFAEKLIKTLPYTPVKGIYSSSSVDYTDHGAARDLGRIYGLVPENPNFAWEKHLDADNIEREYACVDVYLYTALYSEAEIIAGKSQSMELYPPSIKGTWQVIDGRRQYVFEDAAFLGLQVLGDDTEPCFEGAGFFSLFDNLDQIAKKIQELNETYSKLNIGGKRQVENSFFKLSDNQKYEALWALLNPDFNEAGNWAIKYAICDVYDEYAVCRNYENGDFERIYYEKDDDMNAVKITGNEKCFIIDVNEAERQMLINAKKRCGSYSVVAEEADKYNEISEEFAVRAEKIDELNSTIEELNSTIATYQSKEEELIQINAQLDELKNSSEQISLKVAEYENQNATLLKDNEELNAQIVTAAENFQTLQAEAEELRTFKYETEKAQKMDVINRYAEKLGDEILDEYRANVDNYSAYDLDKELAYKLVSANPNIFSKAPTEYRVPKEEAHEATGVVAILSRYRKN